MTRLADLAVPFEKQLRSHSSRMCGAAALCMVYRSLGVACTQQQIWEQIARPDRNNHRAARTHLLAANALCHGLGAICFEAVEPWTVLERGAAGRTRVILNHRLRSGSLLGHYTVLVAVDGNEAIVHDPRVGPDRRLAKEELLGLWRPADDRSEVAGHVLVAIGPALTGANSCGACRVAFPSGVACPKCHSEIPLRPAGVLGCPARSCPTRLWVRLFCPYCDASIASIVAAKPGLKTLSGCSPRGR